MPLWIISGNAFQNQEVVASVHSLSESHAADIDNLKETIDQERDERKISFSNITQEQQILSVDINHLTGQMSQVLQIIDDSVKNISSEY